MRRLLVSGTAALAFAGTAWAQTEPYVIFSDNPDQAWIVQGGAFVDTWPHETDDLAIAVGDTIRALDWSLVTNGSEYDLGGAVLHSDVYPPIPGFQGQALDGASDGAGSNFVVEWLGQGNVWETDRDWGGAVAIFNTGLSMTGVTCDTSNGTLWIAEDNTGRITNYAMDGTRLATFSAGAGRWGCLAYEASTDTLWMVDSPTSEMRQYRKDGTLLRSQFGNREFGLVWGGEFPKAGDPCANCPCPEDVNRDGTVDFADILRILAAWGPCEEPCDDCEDGFVDRCGGTDDCLVCQTPDGRCLCTFGALLGCSAFEPCRDGDCPPGFICCVNTCCPEPICMALCEAGAPAFERAAPGERTPSGVAPATVSLGALGASPVTQPVVEVTGPAPFGAVATPAFGPGELLFERALSFNGDDGPFSDMNQQIADSFAIFPGATLTAATWYGNFFGLGDPFDTGDTWDFLVRIFEDAGGVPQNVPFYEIAVTAEITDDGIQQFDDRIYLFTTALPPVELAGDTLYYFMVLSSTPGSFRWNNGMPTDGTLTFRNGDEDPDWSTGTGTRESSAFALFGGGDPCDDCPCPEDINRDGVVSFADILRVLAAWGPCPDDCDDCEDGFIDRCGDTDACHECMTPTGECVCVRESPCDDNFACRDGECPPGFFCCVGTCCGFPICLPVCDVADGAVPAFEPGDRMSGG